jgi:hypothetical protein
MGGATLFDDHKECLFSIPGGRRCCAVVGFNNIFPESQRAGLKLLVTFSFKRKVTGWFLPEGT